MSAHPAGADDPERERLGRLVGAYEWQLERAKLTLRAARQQVRVCDTLYRDALWEYSDRYILKHEDWEPDYRRPIKLRRRLTAPMTATPAPAPHPTGQNAAPDVAQ